MEVQHYNVALLDPLEPIEHIDPHSKHRYEKRSLNPILSLQNKQKDVGDIFEGLDLREFIFLGWSYLLSAIRKVVF